MKRRLSLRRSRFPRMVLALPGLLVPGLAAGLAEAATSASSGSAGAQTIKFKVTDRRIGYGQRLTVDGQTPPGGAGQHVKLEFAPAGTTSWRPVGQATVGSSDKFQIATRLRRSGLLKVKGMWSGTSTPTHSPRQTGSTTQPSSGAEPVKVSASFHLAPHSSEDMGGHSITIQGKLLPAIHGRRVHLQALRADRWTNVAHTSTNGQGHFRLRYSPGSGKRYLRVSFGGDRSNATTTARSASVTVFRQGVASWYQDGGATACGFHAQYGVANLSLPCGTKVTFLYHGRKVTATVDDRGPYVGGREWDLNQNTAGALGFNGVASVWASR